ncbi:hypothetical protein D3H64_01405 [Atopobacter sp. AH10]|nr:hypothetical protein D3H64_01405 [Atopobacter sp. AH10]
MNSDWSHEEIALVVNLYSLIEDAYERRARKEDLCLAYQAFKRIVPSKSEEKQLDKAFEEASGYSIYRTMKATKEADIWVKMEESQRQKRRK